MTVSVGIVTYFSYKANNCNKLDGLAPRWRGEFELLNCLALVRAGFPSSHAVKVCFLKGCKMVFCSAATVMFRGNTNVSVLNSF